MKKLSAAALLLTAGFSMSAHAGFISGPITFDGGKSVDLQGLEWMPLSHTLGLSRADVEGGFSNATKLWGSGGWRYATRNETEKLIGSLWGGRYSGWSGDNFAGAVKFMEMFGVTAKDIHGIGFNYAYFLFGTENECRTSGPYCYGYIGSVAKHNGPIEAQDKENNWQYKVAYTPDMPGAGVFLEEAGVNMGRDDYNITKEYREKYGFLGSMLVRDRMTTSPTVSSPGALSLIRIRFMRFAVASS